MWEDQSQQWKMLVPVEITFMDSANCWPRELLLNEETLRFTMVLFWFEILLEVMSGFDLNGLTHFATSVP